MLRSYQSTTENYDDCKRDASCSITVSVSHPLSRSRHQIDLSIKKLPSKYPM
ncbi:unnamed protein product [Dovyalis caffra]|uniref:Uncharacterized protein n=1 Tax=Dovyalis caffra TaxID=77055 RepID=A0AAV1SDZ1_9ROSI|nr:unnamed protein product [Dovyalis caffra]